MEEGKVSENHLTSAAAFVEGGIQEACDDACSICLEPFCDSDPSTLTSCKHEFHLQCVLEWCQRSSHCPMCWQPISLKDPGCQELLEAVEHERAIRMTPARGSTIFHHPTLGDFELQHLPANASETELEERIIQHLAAAAAMGRARQLANREGRARTSQGRPHYVVLSTHANGGSGISPTPRPQRGSGSPPARVAAGEDSLNLNGQLSSAQADQLVFGNSGSSAGTSQISNNRRSPAMTSPTRQDRAGPSDLQSFSDSLKTRLSALSRYKETITKSTRSWKERLFARNSSTETSFEVNRESSQSVPSGQSAATLSRMMMDHLQISESTATPNITEQGTATTNPNATLMTITAGASSPFLTEEIARAAPNGTPAASE